jgi:hypothetical protein
LNVTRVVEQIGFGEFELGQEVVQLAADVAVQHHTVELVGPAD